MRHHPNQLTPTAPIGRSLVACRNALHSLCSAEISSFSGLFFFVATGGLLSTTVFLSELR